MVKRLEAYPYSSYHYFLEKQIPECLAKAWVVQNFQDDREAMKVFLNSAVDTSQLQEMKKASSLVEAPNIDKRLKEENLRKIFKESDTKQQRNVKIVQAYKEGYSQHMMAKVLEMAQTTVNGIVKRGIK